MKKQKRRPRPFPDDPHRLYLDLGRLEEIEQRILALAGIIDLATEGHALTPEQDRSVRERLTVAYLGSIARSLDALAFRAS